MLVLASASSARASLLRNAGVAFEVAPAKVDEGEVKIALRAEGVSARDQADALAEMKALQVSRRIDGVLTLGADQILEYEGVAFDKPNDRAEAREQLLQLRGGRHDLWSAAVIAENGSPVWRKIGRVRLWMRTFSEAFLDDYLDQVGDEVLNSVGAYHLEGRGAQLFSRIEGDYFTVLGLPLLDTLDYLRTRKVLSE